MDRIKTILLILFLFYVGPGEVVHAQVAPDPVQWSQELIRESDSIYILVFEARIDPEWHLYSQHTPSGGALPTEFTFKNEGRGFKTLGPVQESETHTAFSTIFGVEETFFKGTARFTQKIQLTDLKLDGIQVDMFYQVCAEVCIGADKTFLFALTDQPYAPETIALDAASKAKGEALLLDLKNKELLGESSDSDSPVKQGIWVIFGLGFIGGLLALLTPCVFPMIPLTVSFFTKQTQSKSKGVARAAFYGFCIVLIYFLLSLPFHFFDSVDSQILNTIATNIWLNIFFFAVFVAFAFSFFGYYELTLPASWASKADQASDRIGGAIGIFFMALTLAIVSFSCTGPILGGLLGSTALSEGDVASNLTAGMMGFGLALALPFTLFALFPSWLQRLPSSGGWMETVKVVLGFLELGLALKFLSNADLIGNWGILKREVFLGIWILLALLLAAYLLGLFRFRKTGNSVRRSPWSMGGALVFLGFGIYLTYGLITGVPLKMLSGFPPPDFYSLNQKNSECPLGLECYKDFEQGLAVSRDRGKPILLDFTGWACVNCRKMEEQVWSDPQVFQRLRDDYVLISLYVDERKLLPEDQQFVFAYENGTRKEIESVGDYWSTFQNLNFGAVSQPYYVLLSPSLEILSPPVQNTDTDTYRIWLDSGIRAYEDLAEPVTDPFALPQSAPVQID